MDPRHRDRVAFVRVCSGRFTKDMAVLNSRVGPPDPGVACLSFLRPRTRNDQRRVRGGHHRPGEPGAVHHRRHDPFRRAGAVPRSAAVSGGALRPRPPPGHALQAVRRRAPAARGRGADAGVLRHERPPRADRRRRRRAAVRRHREPPPYRVLGGRARSSPRRTPRRDGLGTLRKSLPSLGGQTVVAVDRQERRVLLFGSEWERRYFERQHPNVALLAESPVVATATGRN